MSKERPVRVFVGKHLSLRGREVKVTVLTLILGGSGPLKSNRVGENLILTRSVGLIGPRSAQKPMMDVECRKTLDSTARPRRQSYLPCVFY